MKNVFVIGGMGAGKSTAAHALEALGLPAIDLDEVASEVLAAPSTRKALGAYFGPDVLDEEGYVRRAALAAKAFATPEATQLLNDLTQPTIYGRFRELTAALAAEDAEAVVVEYPLYPQMRELYVADGDVILAVCAPMEERVARAVAAGFDEADVVRRIAAQADEEERIAAADAVFVNDGTPEALAEAVQTWWRQRACAAPEAE